MKGCVYIPFLDNQRLAVYFKSLFQQPVNFFDMNSTSSADVRSALKRTARQAGLFYVLLGIVAPFAILYVPSQIKVQGDVVATVRNIIEKEFLFRAGIAAQLVGQALSILVVLLLYKLFKGVNAHKAKAMVALSVVGVPIVFVMEAMNLSAILIAKGQILKSFDPNSAQDLVTLLLRIHDNGIMIVEIFWGLWLIPFGELVIHSRFIPRIFGILLILNGIAYLVASLVFIVSPQYANIVGQYTFPLYFGELAIMFWLLIKGVRNSEFGVSNLELKQA